MKNNKIPQCQNSSYRKIKKYHTVRTVPTSMKNNKIPQSGQFQKPIEKQQNTTLARQFQNP
jgi:hypothetical protein